MKTEDFLEDLESQIDPVIEDELLAQWQGFCLGGFRGDFFSPNRAATSPRKLEWPAVSVNTAMDDPDKMLIQQLGGCSTSLCAGNGLLLGVRSNFGVATLAMPFGTEIFVMDEATNELPTCRPLGTQKIHELAESGFCPSTDHPYLQKVYAMGRVFADVKAQYPKIGKYLLVYHPDFQGPMDLLELIWGSEIFTAFVDEPEFVHRMLRLITDFYIEAMLKWQTIMPLWDEDVSCHWSMMQPGQIMLRDDSAMNLSPAFFEDFILPYDQELLERFGGGCIHACGRVDHFSPLLPAIRGLTGFNLSQPHLNDMEKVLQNTIDKGLLLLGLPLGAAERIRSSGRQLHGRVHAA